jgi:hypothetical protein
MFVASAAEDAFQMNAEQGTELLDQLVALRLIEPVEPKTVLAESGIRCGHRHRIAAEGRQGGGISEMV